MVESLKAGVELPPVIADKISKRTTDGFHRVTAAQKFSKINKEKKAMINVIFKEYNSEEEMFLDAMRYNASHGRMLTQYDRAHCIIIAEELKLSANEVANALSITIDKYGELKANHIGELTLSTDLGKKKPIPLKRTIRHKKGQTLNKFQAEANERLGGMNQMFYVNQIIDLIENDLLDIENKGLMERIEKLRELLYSVVIEAK
jgi:hypothetical protein